MISVSLKHKTRYEYDRLAELGPQVVRLRPAPQCRTPIVQYSLNVTPAEHFVNWQQDAHGNYLARFVFSEKSRIFEVDVELVAEMTVINPFDFFLEDHAEQFPFQYDPVLKKDLRPYLELNESGAQFATYLAMIDRRPRRTIDFLVDVNQQLQNRIDYVIRMEPGVQTCEQTLRLGKGSCRDSAWVLVQLFRHLGLASRFVSGYLIQLKPDVESIDGPSGASEDFTDLHAWTEVYLPGAGWVGLDPTSGLFAGEGHIPLACTPEPVSAAPITGMVEDCEVSFSHSMCVERVREDPRVSKPYTDDDWSSILRAGDAIEERLVRDDVRLTIGGEPTFVSIDDMEGDEWNTAALGPTKTGLSNELICRLRDRFARGGLIHYGTGKWYPGEPLPRWSMTCLWRADGQPIWTNPDLLAEPGNSLQLAADRAKVFAEKLATILQINTHYVGAAYEDAAYCVWKERRLAINEELQSFCLDDVEERGIAGRMLERGLSRPVGWFLPLQCQAWNAKPRWISSDWLVRDNKLFLVPGDSPMGLRLPLEMMPVSEKETLGYHPEIPFETTETLPSYATIRQQVRERWGAEGDVDEPTDVRENGDPEKRALPGVDQASSEVSSNAIRTAMCFEVRNGTMYVFMPPMKSMEEYLELLSTVEQTAEALKQRVVIEGYLPPSDYRLHQLKVTPDPGVIEVNVQPAENWREAVHITQSVYDDARATRLGTEKFDQDGTHTGTGGGNHVVLGGRTPADSPFLRRPHVLRSLLAFWHNHPSLSYLFSGRFIGPTSQAPRIDEGRRDAVYELQVAFEQIPDEGEAPPWLVDRVFRHLLVDLTGNTHRAEFCIDKLYSPDGPAGRLGLLELRAFEMPPHWQMSLTQQLLIRALVSQFWNQPFKARLIDWNTSLHDRWMLPHFVRRDFQDVIAHCTANGFSLNEKWFAPHFEFRFPLIGESDCRDMSIELRLAIEPWYVLGEESGVGGQARYVDSSVERLQVKVNGMFGDRFAVLCNGRRVPLRSTGIEGEYVAGVRYRAWQPPSCLHPTIPVDDPLVFDIVDASTLRSVGGCSYHVSHPGGLNPTTYPYNAYEAESRRSTRFTKQYSGGKLSIPSEEHNAAMPMTLDLRKSRFGTTWS